jgi:tetratricopeptide (TPR) repeat protein
MKYPKLIVTSGAALLFAVSAPTAWGQTRLVTGSTIEKDAAATQDSASAMDQDVSRKIRQAWSEGKDASGAAAFQENGEIALAEGKQQQARQYFEQALANLGAIEAPAGGRTIDVCYAPVSNNESAFMMDQDVSRKIKQAWSQGKDASGAAAFHENGKIALSKGNEQEAKGFFRSALNELNTLNAVRESEASNRTVR